MLTKLPRLVTVSADITPKTRDMKANSVLFSFAGVDPAILTSLFSFFYFSLHGAALWNLSKLALPCVLLR